jgi:hypothetical protein
MNETFLNVGMPESMKQALRCVADYSEPPTSMIDIVRRLVADGLAKHKAANPLQADLIKRALEEYNELGA